MAVNEENSSPDYITITSKDSVGDEMFFKVKKETKMEKYLKRISKEAASMRFLLDGQRIKDDDTPKILEFPEFV
jgi:hypothetical protein